MTDTLPLHGDVPTDAQRLAFDLRRTIEGEVRFDPGSRHLYATDASNFRQMPIGVVVPTSVDDLTRAVEVCRRHGAPITHRGGGTSLAGQCCNVAVIIDSSKHLRGILDVDVEGHTATVEPGVVLDDLRSHLAPHGLTWGPDPSTHDRCTIGGMLGNDACGMRAFRYGRAQDNVRSLEVLLADGTRTTVGAHDEEEWQASLVREDRVGEVHRRLDDLVRRHGDRIRNGYRDLPRRVSGYNLPWLLPENGRHVARALVGTEGTCVTILSATLELNPLPAASALVIVGYDDVFAAGDAVATVRHADGLYALEGLDDRIVASLRTKGLDAGSLERLPPGRGWLFCEFRAGDAAAAAHLAHGFAGRIERPAAVYTDPDEMTLAWGAREAGLGATSVVDGADHWAGWEDSAVPPDVVGDYLRDLQALLDLHRRSAAIYGHFGDGCLHCRIDFEFGTDEGVRAYRAFMEDAADLVDRYGGSYSGEHGDGQQRGELLERMYGRELLGAMREFKAVWDPDGLMNPGKVVDALPLDQDLRLGPGRDEHRPATILSYPEDDDDFARAARRCVGVGTCRQDGDTGTMCPSYRVTHDEQHSTRGRARLLFEMLQGDAGLDGWRDEHVHDALDLCLSCKACASECPVGVDMATYKSEFMAHHHAGRLRPRVHYALGMIDVWARAARLAPGLANLVLGAPFLGPAVKRLGGVTSERPAPAFAGTTFHRWWDRPTRDAGPQVVLFVDTFTQHFEPRVARAAVEVLEDVGYRVEVTGPGLCCGRPLYDQGMLARADRYLGRLLDELHPRVAGGARIVGLEPSCVAVLRDELLRMRPDDPRAADVAAGTRLLSELLDEDDAPLPTWSGRALVQSHCHQAAVLGSDAERRVLDRVGLDWERLDAGCCGLAGGFGFEAGRKHEVADAVGRERLLPAVRAASPDTVILADGFSCRTQIDHLQEGLRSPRRALHLAELLRLAVADAEPRATTTPVEASAPRDAPARPGVRELALLGLGAAAVAAVRRRRSR